MRQYRYFMFERIMYAVLMALLGILFICMPAASGVTLSIITGITLLAISVECICSHIAFRPLPLPIFLVIGTLFALCGIMCLAQPIMVVQLLSIILGLVLIVDGEMVLYDGIRCVARKIKGSWWLVFLSIPVIVLGFCILFCHFTSTMRIIGGALIIAACVKIIVSCIFGHHIHKIRNEFYELKNQLHHDRVEDVEYDEVK